MERYYETRAILQCAFVKLYPEQFSIVFFFFTLKLYSPPAIFDLEIFGRSKGRKVCSRRNNLWNLSIVFCDSLVISQIRSSFLDRVFFIRSLILRLCVCVVSIFGSLTEYPLEAGLLRRLSPPFPL